MKNNLFFTIAVGVITLMPMKAHAQEAYAALSDDNTTLTFYYDNMKSSRNGMEIEFTDPKHDRGWIDYLDILTTVVFDASFANMTTLTNTSFWFYNCKNLCRIMNIENLRTDNVNNMDAMFGHCYNLQNLDLSNFNTKNVESMGAMFCECKSLKSLDLSNFDTGKVTAMWSMFEECIALEYLDISNFDTSNVTYMNCMFSDCASLKCIDLSSFNTSNVKSVSYMFGSSVLETIFVSDGWSMENVEDGNKKMFDKCPNLVGGSGTKWDEKHVDYTYAHIDGGPTNPGYLTYKEAGGQADTKCAKPTISFVDGELTFSCETEGVDYTYEITSDDTKTGNGNKVKIGGTYKVSVYATKAGYENSDVATLEFSLGADGEICDVNKDGAVDVADISTVISKMAAQARMLEKE